MVDTHCHLFLSDYPDIEDIVKKMDNNIIVISGVDDDSNREVIKLCSLYDNVYGCLGIHPENACSKYNLKYIEEHINDEKIIGVGEIGLDYYYTNDNKKEQIDLFCKQIKIAKKYNKPIVVHSRDAISDTYEIIKKYNCGCKTDIHCYSSSLEMAYKFVELGCKLGIGGVVTFKNSAKLKEVVRNIDLEHLLLETDSPYLSPAPFRGERNQPYNVIYVAKEIGLLKNIDYRKVLKTTSKNSCDFFGFDFKV